MKAMPYVFLFAASTFAGFIGGCHYAYRDAQKIAVSAIESIQIIPSHDPKYDIGTTSYRWSDKMPTTDLTGKGFSGVYHEKWQYVNGKMTILAPIVVVPFKGKAQ